MQLGKIERHARNCQFFKALFIFNLMDFCVIMEKNYQEIKAKQYVAPE